MTIYLIKSILCLLVLWGFYKIALEQTAAHHFKRFYLLGSLVLALTLPLLVFSYTVEVEPQPVAAETYLNPTALTEVPVTTPVDEPTNWLAISLGIIYAAGVLLFGFRFLRNLIRLRKKIKSNEKVQAKYHINVLLAGEVVPHSFLRFIFLPKTEFKTNSIAPDILAHEQAHVTQKHSWDILFIESLQVIFWFNPLLVFLKRSIALTHEFLADRAALAQNSTIENYTNLLFTYSGGAHHTALSSPINYSLTRPPYRRAKKRILMLSKTRSIKKLATRLALFAPVIALCLYLFNQEIVAKPKVFAQNLQSPDSITYTKKPDSTKLQNHNLKIEVPNFLEKPNFIIINDKTVHIDNFVKHIDSLTSNWSTKGYTSYKYTSLCPTQAPYGNQAFLQKINKEFRKTNFYKEDPSRGLNFKLEQPNPKIEIKVDSESVWIGGKITTINNFKKDLNLYTSNWRKQDLFACIINIKSNNSAEGILNTLSQEFKKTKLYEANPERRLLTPLAPNSELKEITSPPPSLEETISLTKVQIYYNSEKISESKARELIKDADQYDIQFITNIGTPILVIKDKK